MAIESKTFAEFIDLWPTQQALADDVTTETHRVLVSVVWQWKKRNSIPPKYWMSMVHGAYERGIAGVTYERLAHVAHDIRISTATPKG